MKKINIAYWVATALISAMMLLSTVMYLTNPMLKEGFHYLGFPDYFRVELAIAKLLGAIVLLVPAIKGRPKDWAYAGFYISFISALIAHLSVGDPASKWSGVIIAMILLTVSYSGYQKRTDVAAK